MRNDELYHYGVKGMKWGVRRYRNPDGTLTEAGKKRANKQARKEVKKERKELMKNRSILSEEDLDKTLNRMAKEQRLKDLDRSIANEGRRYTSGVIKQIGSQFLTTASVAALMYIGKSALTGEKMSKSALGTAAFRVGGGKRK